LRSVKKPPIKPKKKTPIRQQTSSRRVPPALNHKGVGSYKARKQNYDKKQRQAEVRRNRARTESDGQRAGGSGKPMRNFVKAPSKARARDMARTAGHGR